ncbi:MAG: type VI secretion system membrane subunit TssM, partial [Pseudomonadota bacterium]
MKAVLGFFKKRWVISLLGLIALCLVVWFVGPLIAIAGSEPLISPVVRLVVILVFVLIWGANNLRQQAAVNKANREIAEGLVESDGDAGSDDASMSADEVATLQKRFEEAVTVLKKSRKDGAGLYDLPWYIIIGPPGSGKTTALVNSGLNFPLAERFGKEALRGVGGTRNCDWWFTDDAVLLDTAGRYVTQDSHASVDSAAWSGFLDLLKRYRKRRPINGVFVAISLSDLMTNTEAQRDAHIQSIRRRINELYDHFGIRFPVYVLLTKCDLVAGFMEFFDDLGQEERAQVFGMTFPLNERDVTVQISEVFTREYDGLLQRLHDRTPERLNTERDAQRRALIYGFPRQMAALKATLGDFLEGIFGGSRYEEQVLLRGIYFTSGTQEG